MSRRRNGVRLQASRLSRALTPAGLVIAGLCLVAASPAEARCVHSGLVYSCVQTGGKTVMLTCYGAGNVQNCIDFSGNVVLVGRYWRNHLTTVPDESVAPASTDEGEQTQSASPSTSTEMTTTEDVDFDMQLSSALDAKGASSQSSASSTRSAGSTTKTTPRPVR